MGLSFTLAVAVLSVSVLTFYGLRRNRGRFRLRARFLNLFELSVEDDAEREQAELPPGQAGADERTS
jgi:hypothetical protein